MRKINFELTDIIPTDCISSLGLSLGYTLDKSAILECAIKENNLHLNEILYSKDYSRVIRELKSLNKAVIADKAEPKSIYEIRQKGIEIYSSDKYKGMISKIFSDLESYNVFVTRCSDNLIHELNNIKNLQLNSPFIDALLSWSSINLK